MKGAIVAVVMALAVPAGSAPYFRMIDPLHPVVSAGVWGDMAGTEKPAFGSAVALVTHSTRDGSLFQMLQADWTPLAVGGGYADGTGFIALGPSANLAPSVKNLLLQVMDLLDKNEKYPNLRLMLAPKPDMNVPDINISFGPQFLFRPLENGTCLSVDRWRGHATFFAGAAWQF